MKGLKQYIVKHGRHFTEKLACDVSGGRWDAKDVGNAAQKKVYYNVTESTLGDMTFLVNMYWYQPFKDCKKKSACIDFALCIAGDYVFYGGKVFDLWLEALDNKKFDFTPYI